MGGQKGVTRGDKKEEGIGPPGTVMHPTGLHIYARLLSIRSISTESVFHGNGTVIFSHNQCERFLVSVNAWHRIIF
jgi:hypothetical protein